jgi:hypothetical protein
MPAPGPAPRRRRDAAAPARTLTAEELRLKDAEERQADWMRWGPYLADRQWGTVREDYSHDGSAWTYFPHDHARSRAYRWGEDGLLGLCDRKGRLCFAVALWNGRDPILKERLFGLTGPEGNHGEDVKEEYYHLEGTPSHAYLKALYKYPQGEFPYAQLVHENARRGKHEREFELADTGALDEGRYFDVFVEYAKAAPQDVLIRITAENRGPEPATLEILPTLWFRNTWSWGPPEDGGKPALEQVGDRAISASHPSLGEFRFVVGTNADGGPPELLFTDNETNNRRLFGSANASPCVKDAFHEYVIAGRLDSVAADGRGTKAAARYRFVVPAGGRAVVRCRLAIDTVAAGRAFGPAFDKVFDQRIAEADAFYDKVLPPADPERRRVARAAYAGLLWSKQFYHYVVRDWLEGDPAQPKPPPGRRELRNRDWSHLHNRDVISVPDKWEYPWFAAWDLAFHMIPFARIDPEFAKEQLVLFLREWYMHPNGQIPAYEFSFSDANPPVHAWACWRVYKRTGVRGKRDRKFLARCFAKLIINFTWWVNRKDEDGNHIFAGGFLGLDNIGLFDRSRPLPGGGRLEQADGTAWMAFYCGTMLSMALELARDEPGYEDLASKFFEHFVAITDAMNTVGGTGLWDDADGFYYDHLHAGDRCLPLKIRSMVGLVPLFAAEMLEGAVIDRLPGFRRRMNWFLRNRRDLARHVFHHEPRDADGDSRPDYLLSIPSPERLCRVLRYVLDEQEFLSPYGVRSLSRVHDRRPFVLHVAGHDHRVDYVPGDAATSLFGGNSNWRGPVWFPVNFLLIEALERYHHFFGDAVTVECPTGSGRMMNLKQVADELARRLVSLFLSGADGRRPFQGDDPRVAADPHRRNLLLFHEFFDGDTGRGCGAGHQTGWTALAADLV